MLGEEVGEGDGMYCASCAMRRGSEPFTHVYTTSMGSGTNSAAKERPLMLSFNDAIPRFHPSHTFEISTAARDTQATATTHPSSLRAKNRAGQQPCNDKPDGGHAPT